MEFETQRRLSLLECVQGELIELLVLLDRTLALRDYGHEASIIAAFDRSASDRNLAIVTSGRHRDVPGGSATPLVPPTSMQRTCVEHNTLCAVSQELE